MLLKPAPVAVDLDQVARRRLVFASVAVVSVALCLLAVSFAGSAPGRSTPFGPVLGADYPNYYIAGKALNEGRPADLYDDAAQAAAYHRLFPQRPLSDRLPFLYPPWVAQAFRPLAALPYRASFAAFLVLAGLGYLVALSLLRPLVPSVSDRDWRLFLLLAVAFEPFLFECWMGGQLSVLALLAVCLALRLAHDRRPFAAGLALGVLAYKPTLLVFLGLMTLAARRGRTAAGVAVTALAGLAAGAVVAGPAAVATYASRLLGFKNTQLVIPLSKYVDVRSGAEALVGRGSALALAAAVVAMGAAAAALWRWWAARPDAPLTWAATLTVTLVANLYLPVYDMVLLVPGLLLTWVAIDEAERPAFALLAGAVAAAAWVTQPLARATGVQVETFLLVALAAFQLRALRHASTRAGAPSITTG